MGYVRRPGEMMSKAVAKWKPIAENSNVRQYEFFVAPEYWTTIDGDLISSIVRLGLFGAEFHDGSNIKFHTKLMSDRPNADYEIASGVMMPAGDYSWIEHMLKYSTSTRNALSSSTYLSGGQYYDGTIVKLNTSLTYRPSASAKVSTISMCSVTPSLSRRYGSTGRRYLMMALAAVAHPLLLWRAAL